MKLKHLTINFIGDSITEGCCTDDLSNRFTNRIAMSTGAVCNNYGIAGTRIARQTQPSDDPRMDQDLCARVADMDPSADVVVVFAGTNDFGHGDAPFGKPDDQTVYSFCGALHVLFGSLQAQFPHAIIAVLTPMHRLGEENVHGEGHKLLPSCPLRDYVEQIKKTAVQYHLPLLDLYADERLNPNHESIRQEYIPDGLHPNDAGHAYLTEKIIAFLEQL